MTQAWSNREGALFSSRGRFDTWSLSWRAEAVPDDATPVTAVEALRRIQSGSAAPLRRVPIGIIGTHIASAPQRALAEEMGAALAIHGLQLLCGGKGGVMEAAAKGHAGSGGQPIGLVPDTEWQAANPFIAIPLATGIGPARNAIIARASVALVAVGGGWGTLSEMAFGLQFGRLVLSLADAPEVNGAQHCADVAEAMARIAERLLDLPPAPDAA